MQECEAHRPLRTMPQRRTAYKFHPIVKCMHDSHKTHKELQESVLGESEKVRRTRLKIDLCSTQSQGCMHEFVHNVVGDR